MSDNSNTRMLEAYEEQRNMSPLFLSSHFRTPPENFHSSEKVEIDVRRGEPRIAIPLPNIQSGARKHERSKYVNHGYTPPVYDQEVDISAYSTSKRLPGQDPFQSPDFRKNALAEALSALRETEEMIRLAVELQCGQIFGSGVITQVDANGVTIHTEDFKLKATHFVQVSTPWGADGSGDPFADIIALEQVVRRDGKKKPKKLVFGSTAMARFLINTKVKASLDNLGLQGMFDIKPQMGDDAHYFGRMLIGTTWFEIWMYDSYYLHPQSGAATPFVADEHVLMLTDGRLDLTFGEIPMFVPPEARAAQFLPQRMSSAKQGFDLTTNVWVTPDGKHLKLTAGTRALAVPTAGDTFGRLRVTAP